MQLHYLTKLTYSTQLARQSNDFNYRILTLTKFTDAAITFKSQLKSQKSPYEVHRYS